jgi:uncharacterized cupredoxin-like copper-binding protein
LFTCAVVATALPGQAYAQRQHDEPAAGDAVVVEVDMRDHAFSPTALRIPAGQPVTLVFRNSGSVDHEFMAGRGVSEGDFELDLFEGIDVAIEPGMEAMMPDHHDDPDTLPHDHGADDDHRAAVHDHDHGQADHGTMASVEPGRRATMSFTLPADRRGEWEMACFFPNHYERGMHGSLSVY